MGKISSDYPKLNSWFQEVGESLTDHMKDAKQCDDINDTVKKM